MPDVRTSVYAVATLWTDSSAVRSAGRAECPLIAAMCNFDSLKRTPVECGGASDTSSNAAAANCGGGDARRVRITGKTVDELRDEYVATLKK